MRFRGIRGAVTVETNTERAILEATTELLQEMVRVNQVDMDDIAAVLFTVTPDLNASFPSEAGRRLLGLNKVPLMCAEEIPVPGALRICVRVFMLVHSMKSLDEIH